MAISAIDAPLVLNDMNAACPGVSIINIPGVLRFNLPLCNFFEISKIVSLGNKLAPIC